MCIDVLGEVGKPAVLVAGNNESTEELTEACRDWPEARVLHGSAVAIAGVTFFGLGGGVPVTPFGAWSYDFTEEQWCGGQDGREGSRGRDMKRVTTAATPVAHLVGPSKLKVVNGRLAYATGDATSLRLDPAALNAVYCYGAVGVTNEALQVLLAHEIDMA